MHPGNGATASEIQPITWEILRFTRRVRELGDNLFRRTPPRGENRAWVSQLSAALTHPSRGQAGMERGQLEAACGLDTIAAVTEEALGQQTRDTSPEMPDDGPFQFNSNSHRRPHCPGLGNTFALWGLLSSRKAL